MAFELATGDCLFNPQPTENHSTDEHHIAQIIQVFGDIPTYIAFSGTHSVEFFNNTGKLNREINLQSCNLHDMLRIKYDWNVVDSQDFTNFLTPMLFYDPNRRATAYDCFSHPWLAEI